MHNNGNGHEPMAFEQVTALGKEWMLSHLSEGIQKAYAARVRSRTRERVREEKQYLSPGEYATLHRETEQRLYSGAYDWGCPADPKSMGSAVAASINEAEGANELMRLLLHEAHGDVSLETMEAIAAEHVGEDSELTKALKKILSYGKLDPNLKAPEKPGKPITALSSATLTPTC